MLGTGKRGLGIVAAILVAGILAWNPGRHLLFSVRLALDMKALAAGSDGSGAAVVESRASARDGDRHYEALYYRPAGAPAHTAVVLSAGISPLGCYHERLVALARLLASRGLLVITPDIREFRQFQITAAPVEQMLFWHARAGALEGGERIRKTGLAGVSYSGTLALMAAARPEVRDRTAFVAAIGPYYDLKRCSRGWFAAGSTEEWKGYYPTRYYARWVMMLSALDLLEDASDRRGLRRRLESLLLQEDLPGRPDRERWHTCERAVEIHRREIEAFLSSARDRPGKLASPCGPPGLTTSSARAPTCTGRSPAPAPRQPVSDPYPPGRNGVVPPAAGAGGGRGDPFLRPLFPRPGIRAARNRFFP